MAKRIQIGNRFFRERRGKLVEIPPEWVGSVTHPQTIKKRPSKSPQKNSRHGMRGTQLSQ